MNNPEIAAARLADHVHAIMAHSTSMIRHEVDGLKRELRALAYASESEAVARLAAMRKHFTP